MCQAVADAAVSPWLRPGPGCTRGSHDDPPDGEKRHQQSFISFGSILTCADRQTCQLASRHLRSHPEGSCRRPGGASIEHPPPGLTGEDPCAADVAEVELDRRPQYCLSPVLVGNAHTNVCSTTDRKRSWLPGTLMHCESNLGPGLMAGICDCTDA
jgi:hypothetical protein